MSKYLSRTTQSDISWLLQGLSEAMEFHHFEAFQMHRQVFIISLLVNLPIKRLEVHPDNQQLLGTCHI